MRRLQSAMEYLMTYGWAILAIAIVMVSLYSLGIFNLQNLSPTAAPGSCEVLRTAAQTSLAGQCNNLIPKYVGKFNGQSVSYVNAGSSLESNVKYTTATIWVDLSSYNTSTGAADAFRGGVAGWIIRTYDYGANVFRAYVSIGGTWYSCTINASYLHKWAFLALTYDGSKVTGYLNGVSKCSTPIAGTLSITSNTTIGTDSGFVYKFNGALANAQLYNISLDNNSIKALYQEGIGGAPVDLQHLVGWWPLNGNSKDYSGNHANGVAVNIIWIANWQSEYAAPTT
ncbi:MAG: hypothetical protein KGH69_04710 [Candidatus Micrarchaeota archaeon]|nr:hypothetical protein [Candidatus Micrarchaeota archaeon]